MSEIQLVVQADDLGLWRDVNAGIVRAFREGIVTRGAVMALWAWVPEAIEMARGQAIPVRMHGTLDCEWEHRRWGPLTDGGTLRDVDGALVHGSVPFPHSAMIGTDFKPRA